MKNFKIDFIGIGAAKCATTYLARCLSKHPDIFIPKIKELNYFSKSKAFGIKSEYEEKGIEGYYACFSKNKKKKFIGEFSTAYLPDKRVAKIIKKHFPNIKIIVSLRDPIERVYSDYLFHKNYGLGKERGFVKTFHKYKYFSLYYEQLKEYFNLFPRKNIKVVLVEDLEKNPLKIIQNLYKFIGADSNFIPKNLFKKENKARKTKFLKIRKLINLLHRIAYFLEKNGLLREVTFLKRRFKLNRLVVYINEKNSEFIEKPKLNKKTKNKLKKEFAEDIKKLEKLIKRDLSVWKKGI